MNKQNKYYKNVMYYQYCTHIKRQPEWIASRLELDSTGPEKHGRSCFCSCSSLFISAAARFLLQAGQGRTRRRVSRLTSSQYFDTIVLSSLSLLRIEDGVRKGKKCHIVLHLVSFFRSFYLSRLTYEPNLDLT